MSAGGEALILFNERLAFFRKDGSQHPRWATFCQSWGFALAEAIESLGCGMEVDSGAFFLYPEGNEQGLATLLEWAGCCEGCGSKHWPLLPDE